MPDTILITAILGLAIMLILDQKESGSMYDLFSGAAIHKALGAVLGAGVVAWCLRSVRWIFEVTSAAILAVIFGSVIPDYVGWEDSKDTWLATGGIIGVIGPRLVSVVPELIRYLKARLKQKAAKLEEQANEP